jgi:hypothetical protein
LLGQARPPSSTTTGTAASGTLTGLTDETGTCDVVGPECLSLGAPLRATQIGKVIADA